MQGGDSISLGLVDGNGQPVELEVSTSDACAMAMMLPRLLKNSIREKYRDESLRYVFPLDSWQVETSSDGTQIIVTLTTGNGFEVSFTSKPATCRSLGSALSESTEQLARKGAAVVN